MYAAGDAHATLLLGMLLETTGFPSQAYLIEGRNKRKKELGWRSDGNYPPPRAPWLAEKVPPTPASPPALDAWFAAFHMGRPQQQAEADGIDDRRA